MINHPYRQITSRPSNVVLLVLAFAALAVHVSASAFCAYGYFRDELYYLACTEHPDLGYVDQPPLSIYILALNRLVLGDSLVALRFLPAVAHALTVLLAGLIARQMGGGRRAQTLAAFACLASPIYLGMNGIYSMNCFDILVWTATAYVFTLILRPGSGHVGEDGRGTEDGGSTARTAPTGIEPRLWLLLGLLLGIGLLNKISVLWLGGGITAGLLLTHHRRVLRSPWPWIAGGLALLLFLPYVIWNIRHDFAHLEFIRNASGGKYSSLNPLTFITGQVMLQNPLALPLWIAGLASVLFGRLSRTFRPLGIVYLFCFLVLMLNGHSKAEYLSASYAMLFAAGGVAVEGFAEARRLRWIPPAFAALLLVSGCVMAPFAEPLLPVKSFIAYEDALGVAPSTPEGKHLDRLPQFYADMFGWEEKAAAVARAFNALPQKDKDRCALFADNYGRCAAIDFFGARYGLPKSIGNHNSYWVWGPRGYTGEVLMILGGNPEEHKRYFEEVTVVDTTSCTYCMPYENHLTISLCRRMKVPLQEAWARIRHYE